MSTVTADIVRLNKSTGGVEVVVTEIPMSNDVFDIPDVVFDIPVPAPAPPTLPPAPPTLPPAPPAPAPAPAPAPVQKQPAAFIQNINNSAFVDVMRNPAPVSVKSPTTVSTRITDISSSTTTNTRTHTNPHAHAHTAGAHLKSIHEPRHSSSSTRMLRHNKHKPTTVMVEDEYKDTSIDYDDDDPEVKKTKASLFNFVKDIAFNLIFTIPSLRTKLKPILNNPALAINQIERIFDEFKDELDRVQLESIKRYVCVEGVRDKLNYILEAGFKKILADGKIDINDAPQFIQLVYFIIHSFNNINNGEVFKFAVSREHVMLLLHFILKSVFCLTLDGEEEQMAFGLVDTSFKLVKIEVCPLISKRWYHKFRVCRAKKVLEDLVE